MVRADLQVPDTLEFEEGTVGDIVWQTFEIRNEGEAPGAFESAAVAAPFLAPSLPSGLGAGARVQLRAGYAPTRSAVNDEAILRIRAAGSEFEIVCSGRTSEARLEASSREVDFGVVNEGEVALRSVLVRNTGGSPFPLADGVWTSTSTDLSFLLPEEPQIPARSELEVVFRYAPSDFGFDRGFLRFGASPLEIEVSGKANLRPQVELLACLNRSSCSRDGQRELPVGLDDIATFEAEAVDPEGEMVGFRWRVVERPEGSNAAIFELPLGGPKADLQVDRVGRYVVEVVAVDERGLASEAAQVVLRPSDLRVSLAWNLPTDVDLHLVAPDGAIGDYGSGVSGSTGLDCSPFNRNPSWGAAGPEDDPRLERDAVVTSGPESIRLEGMESGRYRVYAHYCDSRNVRSSTGAVIEVWSRGLSAGVVGPRVLEPGDIWLAAELEWDADIERVELIPMNLDAGRDPGLCRID